ncbi:MAG: ATPase domain-containing protein [Kofleriaceae bacterium]
MTETISLRRVETGIPGLDTILRGGLLQGGVYLLEGAPGGGKTLCANQICFHRAGLGDNTIYVTLLAESHTRMITHLRGMSFFKPELVGSAVYYISAFKVLESSGLEGLVKSIQQAITQRQATFLVLDGLVSAEEMAPSERDFKKFVHELQTISGMTGCTILLLASSERPHDLRTDHTMVDGLIELGETLVGAHTIRHISVRKLRGVAQVRGRHAFEITNAGVRVRPRLETRLRGADDNDDAPAVSNRLVPFGVTGLDAMLRGGLPAGSNTIVFGPSGSGKTMLGLQFLAAGARVKERGLYLGFYERPRGVVAKAHRLGLGLGEAREHGLVDLLWEAPIEGVIDAVADRLLEAVAEKQVQRVCFDGLHGFRHHEDFPDRTRAVFTTLADELSRHGVTSIFTLETPDLLGPRLEMPIGGISALAENLILLRHLELRSHLRRLITILKVRDHGYDSTIREFQITDQGVVVADKFESAEQILTGAAHIIPGPESRG